MEEKFSLFEATDEELYKALDIKSSFFTSEVLVLSIINGIKQYVYLDKHYLKQRNKDYLKLRIPLREKYFNRLSRLASQVDLKRLEEFLKNNKELKEGIPLLQKLQEYFISKEEYEKCTSLRDIIRSLENS